MKTIKEKQLEFLEETIKHFNSENRGYDGGRCSYVAQCAVGRKIPMGLCEQLDELDCKSIYPGLRSVTAFEMLPLDLQELGQEFLIQIQALHDVEKNWNHLGLSEAGEMRVKEIKKIFGL